MVQKRPVDDCEWVKKLSKFDECFMKVYDENNNKGYFLEVDVQYPKNLLERKKLEKVKKLVCGIEDKEKYVAHIRTLNKH